MYEPQFNRIEKIKIIQSTFMAACGLFSGRKLSLEYDTGEEASKVDLSVVRGLVKSVPGAKCQDFGKVCLLDDEESEGYGLHQIPAKETA